jgi:hypothetical protein
MDKQIWVRLPILMVVMAVWWCGVVLGKIFFFFLKMWKRMMVAVG